jgi:diacylglycerol kinase (ATP)
LVIVAGGDGTINEAAEGLIHSAVPLAILPAGTANVLAMEAGIGSNLERAAERLDTLQPLRIAVGHIACESGRVSRHFLSMAGAGLDAQIVYRVNAGLKSRTGKFAYWLAGWSLLGRSLPQLRARSSGGLRECSFALLSRVRNYGGDFQIAPTVTLRDNCLEAVLFEGRSSVRYVKYFVGMLLHRLSRMKGVTVLRTPCMTLEAPHPGPIYVQIDGELAGRLPAEVRIVPDALTLLLPSGYGTERIPNC